MNAKSSNLRKQLILLQRAEPFELFRIKLVNGDHHDVFDPQVMAILRTMVWIFPPDQNWVTFPINKIASLESLMADFHAELAQHQS